MEQYLSFDTMFTGLHHIAIIASDYPKSKQFYTEILGFELISENYRAERDSWKADLSLNGDYLIELFSFPKPAARLSQPEATGLRHIAFCTPDIIAEIARLESLGIAVEPVRTDPYTNKQFTFFRDPDDLPIEIYQQ